MKIVAFEGPDYSFKSSLCKKLLIAFPYNTYYFHDPTSAKFLEEETLRTKIENLTDNQDKLFRYHMFMANRIALYQKIKSLVPQDGIVLLDRTYFSTAVYQNCRDITQSIIILENMFLFEDFFEKDFFDLMFFSNISYETMYNRMKADNKLDDVFESSREETHRERIKSYEKIFGTFQSTYPIKRLDGNKNFEQVYEKVFNEFTKIVRK